ARRRPPRASRAAGRSRADDKRPEPPAVRARGPGARPRPPSRTVCGAEREFSWVVRFLRAVIVSQPCSWFAGPAGGAPQRATELLHRPGGCRRACDGLRAEASPVGHPARDRWPEDEEHADKALRSVKDRHLAVAVDHRENPSLRSREEAVRVALEESGHAF